VVHKIPKEIFSFYLAYSYRESQLPSISKNWSRPTSREFPELLRSKPNRYAELPLWLTQFTAKCHYEGNVWTYKSKGKFLRLALLPWLFRVAAAVAPRRTRRLLRRPSSARPATFPAASATRSSAQQIPSPASPPADRRPGQASHSPPPVDCRRRPPEAATSPASVQ
jgi:hypothetical protein